MAKHHTHELETMRRYQGQKCIGLNKADESYYDSAVLILK